jgi:adenosylhomocysteine nucleosidase
MIAAEREELAPLARRLAAPERLDAGLRWAAAGRLGSLPVVLAAGGSGRENARRAVRQVEAKVSLRALVSTGWCGALDPGLPVGQVVVADRVVTEDGRERYATLVPAGEKPAGAVMTVDRFIAHTEEKERLRRSGAVAVEMEAAAVGAEATRLAVPFYCIRAVSDPADRSFLVDFNRARLPGGNFSAVRAARQAGLSPRRWGELLGLWRGARRAAEALGTYLAECHFAG